MGHTFTNHLYHMCWSTKERRPLITPEAEERLFEYLGGTARKKMGILLRISGTADHVHLLARVSPDIAVSKFIGALKASSSKWISGAIPGFESFYWQSGYASFTVSESNWERVAAYIDRQKTHHRRRSYETELRVLLEKHRIPFDRERYLD